MARPSLDRVPAAERQRLYTEVLRALRQLRTSDEIFRFVRELLTPGEILMLGRRIRIARRLLAGESYDAIFKKERVSFTTIQHVDRVIQRGLRGYRTVLKRMDAAQPRRRRSVGDVGYFARQFPGLGPYRFWFTLFPDAMDRRAPHEDAEQ